MNRRNFFKSGLDKKRNELFNEFAKKNGIDVSADDVEWVGPLKFITPEKGRSDGLPPPLWFGEIPDPPNLPLIVNDGSPEIDILDFYDEDDPSI